MAFRSPSLPFELLQQIFKDRKELILSGLDDDEHFHNPNKWLVAVAHVCQSWRHVALATTSLWQDIYVRCTLSWLELCLSHCGPRCALRVTFANVKYCDLRALWDSHADRIEMLTFFQATEGRLECLGYFFNWYKPMPKLLSFRVVGKKTVSVPVLGNDVLSFMQGTLQTLSVRGAYLDWLSSDVLGPRLRHLEYHEPETRPSHYHGELHYFGMLFHVLQRCTGLEELYIRGWLPFEHFADPPWHDYSSVSFPRMRRLSLHTSRYGLTHLLLSQFRLSETAEVSITISAAKEWPFKFPGLLETVPSHDPLCLPMLTAASSARFSPTGFSCFSLDAEGNPAGSLRVDFDMEGLDDNAAASWRYAQDTRWLYEGCALLRHSR